jgi:predicted NBD/HSP70 family sugar kinase
MRRGHFIGIDTHCEFCELAVVNSAGQVVRRDSCDTSIATLRQILEAVPRLGH